MAALKRFVCIIYTLFVYLQLVFVWMGLEKIIYGEVQHRIVDDIISVPILIIIYLMWYFKAEKELLEEKLKESKTLKNMED